ncbi:MAG: ABC transporter permease subunit [Blastocatellia bacterium]|jgi:Cu-processing system permease protein
MTSTMGKVWVIAKQTNRGLIRRRALAIGALYLTTVPILVLLGGYVALGEEGLLVVHVGLAGITLAGLLVAIPGGIGLVRGERERRLLPLLLARPVRRGEVVIGKFLGLALALLLLWSIMMAGLAILMEIGTALAGFPLARPILWQAAVAAYLDLLLVSALALLLSLRTHPTVAAALTLLLYVVGRSSGELLRWAESAPLAGVRLLFRGLFLLLPNFARLNWVDEAAHAIPIPLSAMATAVLYTIFYLVVLLCGAVLVFERDEEEPSGFDG